MAIIDKREYSQYSDQNQAMLDKIALSVYADMGIITREKYDSVKDNVSAQIDLLQSIRDLEGKQAIEFSERFVDRILATDETYMALVPPATLAKSYNATKERLADGNIDDEKRQHLQENLNKITHRIDELISDFAAHIGWHLADTSNIADVYAGYNEMFDAREKDLNEENNSVLLGQIRSNREALNTIISEYDRVYDLDRVSEDEKTALSLEDVWDKKSARVAKVNISDSTLETAAKYRFLDANGDVIPQFINEKGEAVIDYTPGLKLDKNGRLANVIDLARMDVVQQNMFVENEPTNQEYQDGLDKAALYKIFQIDMAQQTAGRSLSNPQEMVNEQEFNNFIDNLNVNGGAITDTGYEAAMDAQVNTTAGWAGRIKQRLGKFSGKATGFFGKVFDPIKKIDKRAKDRIKGRSKADKRQQRIEFFVRMLKGFGSAFLLSATITVVATAAAALSGVSVAVAVAAISITLGIAMSAFQIYKWRKAQREAGKDDSIKAMLHDKRMLATLGTTAIASIALIFGAAGVREAAMVLGYGAMALGGTNNVVSTFHDAKAAGMSNTEAYSWAIAQAVAVIGGGFAGRAFANWGIHSYNEAHPDNRIFQSEEQTRNWQKIGEHDETRIIYDEDGLANMEKTARAWADDATLEDWGRKVDAYNAAHGTNIDKYASYVLSAEAGMQTPDNNALHVNGGGVVHSHGNHTIMGAGWAAENNVSMSDIHALASGEINDAWFDAYQRVAPLGNTDGSLTFATARDIHTDGVLPTNDTAVATDNPSHGPAAEQGQRVFTSWHDGNSMIKGIETNTVDDMGWVDGTQPKPVDDPWAMAMFGTSNPRHESELKDRAGSLADRTTYEYIPDPEPDPEPEPEPDPEPKPIYALPPHEELALPPHVEIKKPWEKPQIILPEPKPTPVLTEHKEPLALPPHVESQELILRVTPEQLHALDANLQTAIRLEEQLQNPKIKGSKRAELQAHLKKCKEKINETKNQLGAPSDYVLNEGKYWAYKKLEYEYAQQQLEAAKQRKITGNSTKYDIREIQEAIERWERKVAEYESEIPDESLFYDPVALHNEHGQKVPKFKLATMNLQQKIAQQEAINQSLIIDENDR